MICPFIYSFICLHFFIYLFLVSSVTLVIFSSIFLYPSVNESIFFFCPFYSSPWIPLLFLPLFLTLFSNLGVLLLRQILSLIAFMVIHHLNHFLLPLFLSSFFQFYIFCPLLHDQNHHLLILLVILFLLLTYSHDPTSLFFSFIWINPKACKIIILLIIWNFLYLPNLSEPDFIQSFFFFWIFIFPSYLYIISLHYYGAPISSS